MAAEGHNRSGATDYRLRMELFGLPAHVLIVHAAVVLVPLAVLLAGSFALVPRWRYLTRWPAVVAALIAAGAAWAARISGQSFLDSRPELAPLVAAHESRAHVLSWLVLAFLALVAVGAWGLGGASGLASGRGSRETAVRWLELVLPAAIAVVGVVTLVWVVLTGDAGARAVWGG